MELKWGSIIVNYGQSDPKEMILYAFYAAEPIQHRGVLMMVVDERQEMRKSPREIRFGLYRNHYSNGFHVLT